jgi:hypothetical protein
VVWAGIVDTATTLRGPMAPRMHATATHRGSAAWTKVSIASRSRHSLSHSQGRHKHSSWAQPTARHTQSSFARKRRPAGVISSLGRLRPRRGLVGLSSGLLCAAIVAGECSSDGVVDTNVPIRWCVIEGSSEAAGHEPGDTVFAGGDAVFAASEIWEHEADIHFVFMEVHEANHFDNPTIGIPVIKDTNVAEGELGDVDVIGPEQSSDAALECRAAWSRLAPEAPEGIVGVTAREFLNAGQTQGAGSHPAFALWIKQASPLTGHRGDDLCGSPRNLELGDVKDGWVILPQPEASASKNARARTLAHELGHALTLGHGNGIDDNTDGQPAGVAGPRRFDQYCDPLGVDDSGSPIEDQQTQEAICGTTQSLMEPNSTTCTELTDLQVEQARDVAALLPPAP